MHEYAIDDLLTFMSVTFQDAGKYALSARETIGVGDVEKIEELRAVKLAATQAGAVDFLERQDGLT